MVSVYALARRRVCGVSSLSAIFAAAIASAAFGFESAPSGTRGIFARLDADRPSSGPSQGWDAQHYYQLAPERRHHRARKHTAPQEAKSPGVSRPERPLFAVISIADQRISIYNHDGLVERSQISTGVPGHPTPKGLFTIIGRERFHRSNLYSGAPMPFMQRITWSGVAMHLGVVPGHPASHGCIRLPAGFAAKLWGMTKIGERVVISPHEVAPSEFTHPLLPTPTMRVQGDPDKTASPANVQEASVVPVQAPLMNPRQYADQLKAKSAAEAAAAIKAVKDASMAVAEKRQESARATAEVRAAEKAKSLAQAKADAAESAFQKASAVANARREDFDKAAAAQTADSNGAAKPDTDHLAKARDDAEAAKETAAATKASAGAALAEATARLQTATSVSDSKATELEDAIRHSSDATTAAQAATKAEKEAILRQAPISVLVSKKDKRVYVRQGLTPIFDAPANVRDPDAPLGSHLYIATAPEADGASLKWSVVSLPSRGGEERAERPRKSRSLDERAGATKPHGPVSSPAEALERVEIAPEIRDRIAERLWAGGSLIISDQPPSSETGAVGTDLTVKMR